jgi:hypothetical protein
VIPIKLLLTAGLIAVLAYTVIQKVAPRLLKLLILVVVLSGIYFVWFPDQTTVIANSLGVARGTDLLIYVWIVLSFAMGLNLNFKVRAARRSITELTRAMALLSAPDGPESPERDREDDPPSGEERFG